MGIGALNEGERRLAASAEAGEIWRPDGAGTILRAAVIRALLLGEALPGFSGPVRLHAKGLRIDLAKIEGSLDLESATVVAPLWFTDCEFDSAIELRQARLAHLALRGCKARGLHGHRVSIDGPCLLSQSENRPFRSPERIDLTGAHIAGELSLLGAEIGGAGPVALDANGAEIGASLFLRRIRASGLIDLTRVTIKGNLHAQGAKLDHPGNEKVVMIARGARIGGDAFLRNEFEATAMVDFTRAEFQGGLLLDGARLHAAHGTALSLNQARIGAALGLSQEGGAAPAGGALKGHLDLRGAKVNEFRDDGSLWPDRKTGFLKIDGFEYERFGGRATPLSGKKRVRWLKLQRPNDLRENFRAQPWEHLIQTFRKMGHANAARHVAIAKEVALHRSGTLTLGQWTWSWFSGLLTGYGYLPMRSVYAAAIVIGIGAIIFASAQRQGIMAPVDATVLLSMDYRERRALPQGYPALETTIYSADVFVPFVEFDQSSRWLPSRPALPVNRATDHGTGISFRAMRSTFEAWVDSWVTQEVAETWRRIEIVLGWILTSLAIAAFSGLLRPPRD